MSTKNIIKVIYDLSQLNERCDEVVSMADYKEAAGAVNPLKEALRTNSEIVALAAPQIGIHQRIFVMRFGKEFKVFMNPIIISQSKEKFLSEEELVFTKDSKKFIIYRPEEITVAFQDKMGNVEQMTFKKTTVTPIMQMIDLVDGILSDVLYYSSLELDSSWNRKKKAEKEEIIKNFTEMVKENAELLSKEVSETPELKDLNDQIEFNIQYLNGAIKPVDADGNIVETGEVK